MKYRLWRMVGILVITNAVTILLYHWLLGDLTIKQFAKLFGG